MNTRIEKYIHADPNIMLGEPVIRGTRIMVELIVEKVAAGETIDQIEQEHSGLTREQIQAALEYATLVFKSDVVTTTGV